MRARLRGKRTAALRAIVVACAVASAAGELGAFDAAGECGSVRYRVLAPDWTWQGERLGVLVTLERLGLDGGAGSGRESDGGVEVALALEFPAAAFTAEGAVDGELRGAVTVAGRAPERFAFRDLTARPDAAGARTLRLRIRGEGGEERAHDIPVSIVRGAAVPRGTWSLLAPIGISLLSLPIFLALLRRAAGPRWWRMPAAPGDGERGGAR